MQGEKHHDPSVLTHFFPGMLSGFVLGGIVGTLVVTHIAASSLQFFWQAVHENKARTPLACADVSGLHMTAETTDAGSVLTGVTIGDGQETLLTVPQENIRYIPSSGRAEAYVTVVSSAGQQSAFPATSLYHLDYCTKQMTHILGDTQEPVEILGMSSAGDWAIYMNGSRLMLMQTDDNTVIIPSLFASDRPEEFLFSPAQDAVALRYANGTRAVWNMGNHGYLVSEEELSSGESLPVWSMQSAGEYGMMMQ